MAEAAISCSVAVPAAELGWQCCRAGSAALQSRGAGPFLGKHLLPQTAFQQAQRRVLLELSAAMGAIQPWCLPANTALVR